MWRCLRGLWTFPVPKSSIATSNLTVLCTEPVAEAAHREQNYGRIVLQGAISICPSVRNVLSRSEHLWLLSRQRRK